jgi:hypothetical protein
MATDNSLITFKAISNFTTCLGEVFGHKHRALKLYAHLITKTTIAHEKPIQKHIIAFREFCMANREAINTKNVKKLTQNNITYSNRVFIDIVTILNEADVETASVIWNHILTISALTDPTGKAREILKENVKKGESNASEADFLSNIIGKVEQHVDPESNPMEAVSSIMKSGIFTELVGGMGNGLQDGSLDLGKLMGTVQKMVTTLSDQTNECKSDGPSSNNDSEQAVNLMSTMMSNLTAGSQPLNKDGNSPPVPDLSALMGMVGPMLGTLSQNSGGSNLASSGNPIEDKIAAQVQQAKKSGILASSISVTDEPIKMIEEAPSSPSQKPRLDSVPEIVEIE